MNKKINSVMHLFRKTVRYYRLNGSMALIKAVLRHLISGTNIREKTPVGWETTDPSLRLNDNKFDIIFAIGCWEGESRRYRVNNIADGLFEKGYKVRVIRFSHIVNLAEQNVTADSVVIFRASYNAVPRIEVFLEYARAKQIRLIFDVDDLVFDPLIVDQVDAYHHLNSSEQRLYLDGVNGYRKMLLSCDFATVPTNYIRTQVEAAGKKAFVIPNSLNSTQLSVAERLYFRRHHKNDFVRIGYFSGSQTHQADFAQCANVIFDLMKRNTSVVLRIVGYLNLDSRWDIFGDRVEVQPFQPYDIMLASLKECSINIAPLEIDNPFCEGKSELKFFEAGILGVPTIASATDTFCRAITNGVNGYCVKTEDEWCNALEALINSEHLREAIGAKARQTSLERYSYSVIADKSISIYQPNSTEQSNSNTAPRTIDRGRIRIAWLVPGLILGGGGHRNIFRAAYFLSKLGHEVSLYFLGTEEQPAAIKHLIKKHFYPLECPVHIFKDNISSTDVVFATHWSTVAAALTARREAKQVMYFVQDFEPAFCPMGTEYVLAENTYRLGLYHITSGPWCEMILKREFQADADHFQFPLDRAIYYPRSRTKTKRNLIFFAKPEMPRRCFGLGVMALNEFHALRPDVEIIMFGSQRVSEWSYNFPVTVNGLMPSLEALAQTYSNADIGLAFSTTNPSLVPYEMMACGLPVVDLNRSSNEINYGGRNDIAFLADPSPKKMALQLVKLLENRWELAHRRSNGIEFVAKFPSEEEMAKRIERLMLDRLSKY